MDAFMIYVIGSSIIVWGIVFLLLHFRTHLRLAYALSFSNLSVAAWAALHTIALVSGVWRP